MKVLLIAASLLMSCGKTESSTVSWGALGGLKRADTMLDARQIMICGERVLLPIAESALWDWNKARQKWPQVFIWNPCGIRWQYDASVKLSKGSCPAYVVGYHTQSGNHHDITLCNAAPQDAYYQVLLHELGHGFGLCDQYAPWNAAQIVFHPNCAWPRSSQPFRSVMGGLYPGSPKWLTEDDIAGIRYLQTRFQRR